MAHHTFVGLPEDFIQRRSAHPMRSLDGMKDLEVKQHLLMDREMSLKESFN
jgi:hypothetical protein